MSQASQVIQHLRRVLRHDESGLTDGQFLGCFIEHRDEAAFAALVKRHGRAVWNVCRRLLAEHDAEDAFQATFLVLCRKAPSIRRRERLASWLYGVAHQTALQARRTAARRRAREKQVVDMPEPAVVEQEVWNDLQPVLEHELSRLPEKYQVVLLLCDLEGKTRKEVARQLSLPEGTVASRLARARTILAKRLTRRGIAVSGATLAVVLSEKAMAASVPPSVVSFTIKAASLVAAGQTASVVSAKVAYLTEGVLKAMFVTKIKAALVIVLVLGFVATGTTIFASRMVAEQDDKQAKAEEAQQAANREHDRTVELAAKQAKTGPLVNQGAGEFGETVDGLRIKLQLTGPKEGGKSASQCTVVMENVGDTDLNINLGVSLSNGKSHYPVAIRLLAIEGKNTTRLTYAKPRVTGRLDPFVLPLPVGSSYTLRCPLDKFVLEEGGGPFDFTAKDYRVRAELFGQPVTETNPDMRGFTLMRFWQGTVQSK